MESADLSKTLEVLKAISDLEQAIANLYRYFSEIREGEKDFWLALEKDEQKHSRMAQEINHLVADRKFFCLPDHTFNGTAVHHLKNFVERHHRKLLKLEIPTDFKSLLSIAWNVEYSLGEMNYTHLFSVVEGELESKLRTLVEETARHRSTLGSRITALRNSVPRAQKCITPKGHPGVQRKLNQKSVLLKLN